MRDRESGCCEAAGSRYVVVRSCPVGLKTSTPVFMTSFPSSGRAIALAMVRQHQERLSHAALSRYVL